MKSVNHSDPFVQNDLRNFEGRGPKNNSHYVRRSRTRASVSRSLQVRYEESPVVSLYLAFPGPNSQRLLARVMASHMEEGDFSWTTVITS